MNNLSSFKKEDILVPLYRFIPQKKSLKFLYEGTNMSIPLFEWWGITHEISNLEEIIYPLKFLSGIKMGILSKYFNNLLLILIHITI